VPRRTARPAVDRARFVSSVGSSRNMSLSITPAVARVRGPVVACVTRCLGASPTSVGRTSPNPCPTALAALGGQTSRGRAASSSTASSSRSCPLSRVLRSPARGTTRPARFSAATRAESEGSDGTVANGKIRRVEERLGVTLSEEPTVSAPLPVVVVVSGPSGVGKDAVVRRLLELRPELKMVVTATDRAPRPGERDGVDYHFVSTKRFEHLIATNQLVEHAVVYGQYKGIPKSSVRETLSANNDVVLRVDVQGASTVRGIIPDAISIFLCAESEASLARRLARRATETVEELTRRVETARVENARADEFDYVVVNGEGQMERAAAKLGAIIDAEKCRRGRTAVKV